MATAFRSPRVSPPSYLRHEKKPLLPDSSKYCQIPVRIICAHGPRAAPAVAWIPRTRRMDMAFSTSYPQRQQPSSGLPGVRVEVRNGSMRPAVYDLTGEEFLIGSVPGCDLRLPGTNLPPVICLIARQPDGVRLRKLAPTLPVLVNGQPISQTAPTSLVHGDCISVGAVDIHVMIELAMLPGPSLQLMPTRM